MGEARRRNKLRQRLLSKQPHCIFCGGIKKAQTVDHIPPRVLFDQRQRPAGLEFSSCKECNQGTRSDEQVVSLLSRMYPDAEGSQNREELKRLAAAVDRNEPGIMAELAPNLSQSEQFQNIKHLLPEDAGGALNCKGPLLNGAIYNVGAKLGFALHYELFGKPIPLGGAVVCWWLTNVQALKGELPKDLLQLLPKPSTLKQGSKNVGEQFSYASAGSENGSISAHFCTFRKSFAICAFASVDKEKVVPPGKSSEFKFFEPGWLCANSSA